MYNHDTNGGKRKKAYQSVQCVQFSVLYNLQKLRSGTKTSVTNSWQQLWGKIGNKNLNSYIGQGATFVCYLCLFWPKLNAHRLTLQYMFMASILALK